MNRQREEVLLEVHRNFTKTKSRRDEITQAGV